MPRDEQKGISERSTFSLHGRGKMVMRYTVRKLKCAPQRRQQVQLFLFSVSMSIVSTSHITRFACSGLRIAAPTIDDGPAYVFLSPTPFRALMLPTLQTGLRLHEFRQNVDGRHTLQLTAQSDQTSSRSRLNTRKKCV